MKIIPRKILVCAKNKCKRCSLSVTEVPRHCRYDVLHALDTNDYFAEKPRRSGKTTKLVELARDLCEMKLPVYYMTRTQDMGTHIRGMFKDLNIKMISLGQVLQGHLNGYPAGCVIADEIQPDELKEVMGLMPLSQFVASYYTSF